MTNNTSKTKNKTKSAVDLAYDGIIDLVLSGQLRPGERTSVYLLADALQIGRTPVREAINRLQSEGFISVAGRSGTVVNPLDKDQAKQLFSLRRELECFAADYAVENVTDADIAELSIELDDLASAGTSAKFIRANTAFHSGIVALAHNPTLDRFYAQLQIQLHVAAYLAKRGADPETEKQRLDEHIEILTALKNRDVAALKKAIETHISSTEDAIFTG